MHGGVHFNHRKFVVFYIIICQYVLYCMHSNSLCRACWLHLAPFLFRFRASAKKASLLCFLPLLPLPFLALALAPAPAVTLVIDAAGFCFALVSMLRRLF